MGDRRRKPEKIKQEKGLGLLCLLDDSGDGLSRLTIFFCWSHYRSHY